MKLGTANIANLHEGSLHVFVYWVGNIARHFIEMKFFFNNLQKLFTFFSGNFSMPFLRSFSKIVSILPT